ncbi:N-acetyltransferase [Pseudomonas sp. DCA-1]|uniref:N-acetyltransferase n=1 Tax=Pseudomonas sp. DCA-1 TaxID=3344874 RepID=UPI0039777329
MPLIDSLRHYLQRRKIARLDAQAIGLQLSTLRSESTRGHFVFPGLSIVAAIEQHGQKFGWIRYCVSPLNDRVYICEFEVAYDQQRRGLGQATLWKLWQQYQVPLSPMHEKGSSIGFWAKARKRFAAAGVELTPNISTAHQPGEQQRWKHLVPECEFERTMREVMASPEWPSIKARFDAEYGPHGEDRPRSQL